MRIIAYTYEADVHCIGCAWHRFAPGAIGEVRPNGEIDEHGPSIFAADREGNPVRPVFSTDKNDFKHCGTCGATL